ncbi:neuronal calcium sensor 2-like [Brachionus plicatilis]|uniref:Neuronal calcium sensor 2-like n=1 Tax=Brachionus plicatilis TaxID=10195 RepID=A0A3M7T8L6_BRAPC|nr:neuronal calcium sensor 2-like [Brachionus plicatilis]
MGAKKSKETSSHPKKSDPAELTQEEIQLLLQNTHFNQKQIEEWHSGFIKDCPKGKLDKKKFIDVYKQFYPHGKADKFCGHVFKTFDTDGSGEIDFVEFLIAISVTSQGDIKDKLRMAFNMYDIDKNGRIDKKEMEKIIEAIYDLLGEENRKGENSPPRRVLKIMAKLDKNNDGSLSPDEFINGCLNDEILRHLLAPNAC